MNRWRSVIIGAALACALMPAAAQAQKAERRQSTTLASTAALPAEVARPAGLLTTVTFADIGFASGLRFSNLGGRREIFVPFPQGTSLSATELTLTLDDMSAHEARRSLEVIVNDRSAAAIALDGRSMGRQVRIPLNRAKGREGFLKLTFSYSGAATQDRCIDVRYIGDSLTIRPESAIEIDIGATSLDVATTAALMPRDVAVVLSGRKLAIADVAAALTVARQLKSSGRRVSFHHGFEMLPELTRSDDTRRWSRGLVLIGSADEVAGFIEVPGTRVAGPPTASGTLAAVRIGGMPALLVSDAGALRAGRLFASPLLSAARGVTLASVGDVAKPKVAATRVTFEELALAPAQAEVFGRADIAFAISLRGLPAKTKAARLALDIMVAPDGAGEKAVVSVFVSDRLLGSTVAAIGEPTRLDLALPNGLVGTDLNVRTVVQRRSAQGDCRFEPQGYPAQILGSSAVVLVDADSEPHDFSDLGAFWSNGIEVWMPSPSLERPAPLLGLISDALAALSTETAPVTVRFIGQNEAPSPTAPFIAVSSRPPAGAKPRVRFDQGRVAVADRSGRILLDLGGFTTGAVMQIVSANDHPGLWLKPLAADGALPAPAELRLDRGDVAFVDQAGIALAMSTERDTLVRVAYPDQVSWLTVAERFHAWLIGALWLLVTAAFLFGLQRMLRRRAANTAD